MVSTPIGTTTTYSTLSTPIVPITTSQQPSTQLTNVASSILQPTLQPGMPYMPNLLTNVGAVTPPQGK